MLVDSSGSVDGVLDVIQSAALSFAKQLRPVKPSGSVMRPNRLLGRRWISTKA